MNAKWRRAGRIAVAATALGAVAGCGAKVEKAAQADAAPKAVPVTVTPLRRQEVERTVEIVGTLKGYEEVTIGSKRMGRVLRVRHDMGDRVKPGESLVELETVDADLDIAQAERRLQAELAKLGLSDMPPKDFDVTAVPSVNQARVATDRARQNVSRERLLIQRGAGTAQVLQDAENDLRAAEAALENAVLTARSTLASALAARVALDAARQARADLDVKAPIPSAAAKGHVGPVVYALTRRQVAEGQMVRQGDPIAQLVIEDPLRLWADVPERFAAEVKLGQGVRLTVGSHPDRTFEGVVARINPSVDPISRTFQVEASVPNPEGVLRPGGFAKATVVISRNAEAVVVPTESVVRFAGVTKLFLVDGAKARAVEVTTDQEGPGWIEVRGKLPAEAQVVTSGQTQLADGTPVTIREDAVAATAAKPGAAE